MKKCPFCSKEIEDTVIMCHHCGKSLFVSGEKKSKGTKVVAVFIILYSLLMLLGNGISPGGSNLAGWAAIFSIISAVGILRLKKWAWYCGIIFVILDILFYLWGMRYQFQHAFSSIIFLSFWPLACIFYLITPKVKEQFK